MDISLTKARHHLSYYLKLVEPGKTVWITRRGRPVGVIIDPEEYTRLRQAQVYLQMINLSKTLRESGLTGSELYRASRDGRGEASAKRA